MKACTAILLAVTAASPGSAHDARESRYVGLQVVSIPLSARIRDGLASTHPGVELVGVDPGSPADGARLQQQDLIERANGRLLWGPEDLDRELARLNVGDTVALSIRRGRDVRVANLVVSGLPPGHPGFVVRSSTPADTLPEIRRLGLDPRDPLVVVNGSMPGMSWPFGDSLKPGAVILEVQGTPVRTVEEFKSLLKPVHVGDPITLRFGQDGHRHKVTYLAQPAPRVWSGLHLEEVTPLLVEAESLTATEAAGGGLFIRRVEKDSPAQAAGFKPRDRILDWNGTPLVSFRQFEALYDTLGSGRTVSLAVRRAEGKTDAVSIWRGERLDRPRELRQEFGIPGIPLTHDSRRGRLWLDPWKPQNNMSIRLQRIPLPIPVPQGWTKVTGAMWGSATGVRWMPARRDPGSVRPPDDSVDPTVQASWHYLYGQGDHRWHHRAVLSWRSPWVPEVTYLDMPQSFYEEQISNKPETTVLSMFAGQDKLRYIGVRGWTAIWSLGDRPRRGHEIRASLSRVRETALPNAPTSSIFGRRNYTPNPVAGVAGGRSHTLTLAWLYRRLYPRDWTGGSLKGELRMAGGALGGDRSFTRWEVNARQSFRLAHRFYADTRARLGLATGSLPLQERFDAGGKGTLPGYPDHRFSGDRTVIANTVLSWVPLGPPEKQVQYRVFVGADAGHAWERETTSGLPRLRSDVMIGHAIALPEHFQVAFPMTFSMFWARALDTDRAGWRVQVNIIGGAFL